MKYFRCTQLTNLITRSAAFRSLSLVTLVLIPAAWTQAFARPSAKVPLETLAMNCSESVPVENIDKETMSKALSTTGLIGFVHGFVGTNERIPVVTVRSSSDFFKAVQINLIAVNNNSREFASGLDRHDKICIKGTFAAFSNDQLHAQITDAGMITKYAASFPDLPAYEYRGPNPEDLPASGTLSMRVHAVSEGTLILELVDRIVPLIVSDSKLIPNDLYRFDMINIAYTQVATPGRPVHLVLNENDEQPLRVTNRIKDIDGKTVKLTGTLSVFPKSPQINQDTYALKVEEFGFETNYTLVNFENPDLFAMIRMKLADLWNTETAAVQRGRNFFYNSGITLTVEGRANMQSPSQANPQIIIESLDQIKREK